MNKAYAVLGVFAKCINAILLM